MAAAAFLALAWAGYPPERAAVADRGPLLDAWRASLPGYGVLALLAALLAGWQARRLLQQRELVRRLQASNDRQWRLLKTASQNLRAPLTLVVGPLRVLRHRAGLDPEVLQQLGFIKRGADGLLRMLDELSGIDRGAAGLGSISYSRMDVGQLVRLIASYYESMSRDRRIQLELRAPDRLRIEADAGKTERMLSGLLSQAFHATPDGGRLALEVQTQAPGLVAFTLRYQEGAEPARKEAALGEVIVRELAELHGGRLDGEMLAGGTRQLRLVLPVAAPEGAEVRDAAPPDQSVGAPEPGPGAGAGRRRPCILVVDDDSIVTELIVATLDPEYRVICAPDGAAGLAMASRERPDLVITDEVMPGMQGSEMLLALRRRPELQDTPVIMLTARADDTLHSTAVQAGAQSFLVKPFDGEVLLAHVRRLLEERRRNGSRLAEAERMLAVLLESTPRAVFVADAAHRVLRTNASAAGIFGRAASELIGLHLSALFGPSARQAYFDAVAGLQRGQTSELPVSPELTGLRADGSPFPLRCSISQCADASGAVVYMVVVSDAEATVRWSGGEWKDEFITTPAELDDALVSLVEARQTEFARELHDSIGAALAGVSLLLSGARSLAGPSALPVLKRATEEIHAAAEQVRKISRGLLPTAGAAGALQGALERFAEDLSASTRVRCSLHVDGDFREVEAGTGTHLYRIVQEAATNAVRHGQATELRLQLAEELDGRKTLIIEDNGCGCDFHALPPDRPGMGLRSMAARARAIRGTLSLSRGELGGCRVRVGWDDGVEALPTGAGELFDTGRG